MESVDTGYLEVINRIVNVLHLSTTWRRQPPTVQSVGMEATLMSQAGTIDPRKFRCPPKIWRNSVELMSNHARAHTHVNATSYGVQVT